MLQPPQDGAAGRARVSLPLPRARRGGGGRPPLPARRAAGPGRSRPQVPQERGRGGGDDVRHQREAQGRGQSKQAVKKFHVLCVTLQTGGQALRERREEVPRVRAGPALQAQAGSPAMVQPRVAQPGQVSSQKPNQTKS